MIIQIKKKIKFIFLIVIILSSLNIFLIYTSNNWSKTYLNSQNSERPLIHLSTTVLKTISIRINDEAIPLESKSKSPFIFIGGYARSGTTLMVY